MGNHIRIVFGPTLYYIPINRNINFIRLSELAHTAWRGDGPLHFHCIWSNQISCWENVCLLKRDWSTNLQAESIRTSLQRFEIGILSVSGHEYCVCWDTDPGELACMEQGRPCFEHVQRSLSPNTGPGDLTWSRAMTGTGPAIPPAQYWPWRAALELGHAWSRCRSSDTSANYRPAYGSKWDHIKTSRN